MELTDEIESSHYVAQERLAEMSNYYRWILGSFSGFIGKRVWDAGAGVGHVTELLAAQADFVLATEFTDKNLEALRLQFAGRAGVQVAFCDLTKDDALALREHALDTIITLDVLEHLEDDVSALRRYRSILAPGGRLLVKVPSHPFLYGTLDEASLHFRRYGKRELKEKLEAVGFEVERIRHMNMAATVPYFLFGRVLKKQRTFSNSLDDGRLGLYNRLMPWFERAERVLPVPFGLSLVAVGRKSV